MAELKLISMDEVPVEEVQWLWYPYIPYGKLTIIHGDPGEGKTTLILQLAALLSRGEPLPCDDRPQEPVKIIYQTAEDGLGDTIKPRLLAGNADCSQIKVIDETDTALTLLDERVEQAIVMTGAKVMILDPVQAYVGAGMDMNRANEVRSVMAQLGRIAEKHKCAMILVGHLNKSQGAKNQYRGLGSIDFQAAARSVLVVGRIKGQPEVRVIAHEKSSLAPEGEPVAFELSADNGFQWLGHYDISVDDLLSGVSRESKAALAERLILERLSEGPYPQQALMDKAGLMGISKRVVDEAKKRLNVQSVKVGNQWFWQLPDELPLLGCNIAKVLGTCNLAMFLSAGKFRRGCKGGIFKGQPLPGSCPQTAGAAPLREHLDAAAGRCFRLPPRRAHGTLQPLG